MQAIQQPLFEDVPTLFIPPHLVAAGVYVSRHPLNPFCIGTPDMRYYDAPTVDGVLALAQTWYDLVWTRQQHREAA